MNVTIVKAGQHFGPHTEDDVRNFRIRNEIADADTILLEDGSELTVAEFLKTTTTRKLLGNGSRRNGSDLKQFMVTKGMLVRKDQHKVGEVRCLHGNLLTVTTAIVSIGNSAKAKKTYGLIVQTADEEGQTTGSDHVDFDELPELIDALAFMVNLAAEMEGQSPEYTELKYVSRDGTAFGFYQDFQTQQGFIETGGSNPTVFLQVQKLNSFSQLLQRAQAHLSAHGAEEC